jgi:hypothetical protein
MTEILKGMIAAIGIDIGKNWFHVVGLDGRGAIALRQKWSRGPVTGFPYEKRVGEASAPSRRRSTGRKPMAN